MEVKYMFFSAIITVVIWSPIYYLMIKGKIKTTGEKRFKKYKESGWVVEAVSIKCKKILPKLVEKHKTHSLYRNSKDLVDRYQVTYQYTVDGVTYEKKCITYDDEAYETKLTLYYDPSTPEKALTKGEAESKPGCAIRILMLLQFATFLVIANLLANL